MRLKGAVGDRPLSDLYSQGEDAGNEECRYRISVTDWGREGRGMLGCDYDAPFSLPSASESW